MVDSISQKFIGGLWLINEALNWTISDNGNHTVRSLHIKLRLWTKCKILCLAIQFQGLCGILQIGWVDRLPLFVENILFFAYYYISPLSKKK